MNKRRRRIALVLLIAGALMIAASAALIIRNCLEKNKAEEEAKKNLAKVEQAIEERVSDKSHSDESAAVLPVQETKKMPDVEIDGDWYIGYLEFPTLEAKVPVQAGYDEGRLNVSSCCYYGSLETDDLVIAGHNFMTGFSRLGNLKIGDAVNFTNMDGETYRYKVAETEMLGPEQVNDMVGSDYELTLFTCNYSGSHRYTVRCRPAVSRDSHKDA